MAAKIQYMISTPDNGTMTVAKGGKVPTHATWAFFTEENPHWSLGSGWIQMGWSYQTTLADAQRKALPDCRKYGLKVTATPVIETPATPVIEVVAEAPAAEAPAVEVVETPAATVTVYVDMVDATKGLITIKGHDLAGTVLNDAARYGQRGAGWSSEDGDGAVLVTGSKGARKAAEALARALGVTGPLRIELDREY